MIKFFSTLFILSCYQYENRLFNICTYNLIREDFHLFVYFALVINFFSDNLTTPTCCMFFRQMSPWFDKIIYLMNVVIIHFDSIALSWERSDMKSCSRGVGDSTVLHDQGQGGGVWKKWNSHDFLSELSLNKQVCLDKERKQRRFYNV